MSLVVGEIRGEERRGEEMHRSKINNEMHE